MGYEIVLSDAAYTAAVGLEGFRADLVEDGTTVGAVHSPGLGADVEVSLDGAARARLQAEAEAVYPYNSRALTMFVDLLVHIARRDEPALPEALL